MISLPSASGGAPPIFSVGDEGGGGTLSAVTGLYISPDMWRLAAGAETVHISSHSWQSGYALWSLVISDVITWGVWSMWI